MIVSVYVCVCVHKKNQETRDQQHRSHSFAISGLPNGKVQDYNYKRMAVTPSGESFACLSAARCSRD